MTAPSIAPLAPVGLMDHYTRLKSKFAYRHRMAETIHQVRQGNLRQLFPAELEFDLQFEGVPIANFIDIVARDMAEGIAPLPALACVSGKMKSDADMQRAEIKNRIGDSYWITSRLEVQMLRGADRYVSYGFLPIFVEPSVDQKRPYIHLEDPRHAVYELDRFGNVVVYGQEWRRTVDDLCAQYPEYASQIRRNPDGKEAAGNQELKLVRWVDKAGVMLMLPERQGLTLVTYAHKMSRVPAYIVERPGEDDRPRGQFDDVIWVQVARAIISTLALEAAHLAVQAPIAMPSDADELAVGPHAVIQSDQANQIHRLDFSVPKDAFAEGQILDQEMRVGSRYPDARSGGVQASVITGKGIEALLGTFDSQIKGAQIVFKLALEQVTSMCFEMDEVWWPRESKIVSGTLSGASYEFNYQPAKDINGRWSCTVTYGFAAGMQPSQSIITLLQLEGAGLIAKGTTQENLPFSIDHIQEQKKIDVEGWREALKQGMFAYVQQSGQIAAQGGDPSSLFDLAVDVIHRLQDGHSVEDAVAGAYEAQKAKQAQEQAAALAQQQQQGGGPGPDDQTGAPGQTGTPGDVMPPGQTVQGGAPSLQQMIAGFRGNGAVPIMQAQVRRSFPSGVQ